MEQCIADGCNKAAEKGRDGARKLCRGHRKRENQGKPLGELRDWGLAPDSYLKKKAEEWADAKDTDERAAVLAWKRLVEAAVRYAKRRKQKVPTSAETVNRG